MKRLLGLIVVVIHILAVVVGIYAIFSLFNLVPSFKSLFSDVVLPYESFLKLILFVFLPIGIVLFINQMLFGDSIPTKVLTIIGLALMLVPALVFHIQVMSSISSGNFAEFYSKGQASHEYVGLLFIFPVICMYLTTTFQLIGKDRFIIHEDYDDALENAGWILPYIYICGGISLITIFISKLGGLQFCSILTLIIGCISLLVMGISRVKNGSPFEY